MGEGPGLRLRYRGPTVGDQPDPANREGSTTFWPVAISDPGRPGAGSGRRDGQLYGCPGGEHRTCRPKLKTSFIAVTADIARRDWLTRPLIRSRLLRAKDAAAPDLRDISREERRVVPQMVTGRHGRWHRGRPAGRAGPRWYSECVRAGPRWSSECVRNSGR